MGIRERNQRAKTERFFEVFNGALEVGKRETCARKKKMTQFTTTVQEEAEECPIYLSINKQTGVSVKWLQSDCG